MIDDTRFSVAPSSLTAYRRYHLLFTFCPDEALYARVKYLRHFLYIYNIQSIYVFSVCVVLRCFCLAIVTHYPVNE